MEKVTVDAALADWIRTALAACDIFSGLSPELLSNLQARAELWALEPGEVLATENSRAEHFYLVVEGQLDVVVGGVAVAQVGPGMTAGEMGILLDEPRSATLRAHAATSVVAFSARDTTNLIEKLPSFGASIARALAKRLKNANQRIPMPLYEGDASRPDAAALSMLPFTFVRRHRVLPLKMEGNRLLLGCVADLTPELLQNVQSHIPSFELVPMRITGSALDAALAASSAALPVATLPSATPSATPHVPSGPVPPLVPLLRRMIAEGASDLHLTAKQPPWWRTSGDLKIIPETEVLGPRTVLDMLLPVMDERARTTFEAENDVDFAYPVEGLARFRVNMFKDDSGIGAVLRQIPSKILTFEQLGLPPAIARMCDQPRGLVLVTGPTGSGKSTSLNAFLRKINSTDLRIITVEDPIEYEVPGVNQMQIRSEIGLTFASALRSILRQDPDVIMVGEIRDKDTAEIAIRASLTGHLVFSTLHTNDAPGAITRLVDMGIEPFLVASAIELVIAQRLVRRLCPNCCASQPISKVKLLETLAILECDAAEAELVTALKHPVGCDRCRGTGYRGRIGLFEIFRLNDELHELILKRESTRTLTQAARKQGMRTLGQSGWEKVKAGHTTLEEVLRVVTVVEK
jgi:pilus retraction protein PilT